MLSNVDKEIFTNSDEINLLPNVSAEWNQNLFNPPYVTVAGTGQKETVTADASYTQIIDSNKHPNFDTFSFDISPSSNTFVSFSCNTLNSQNAYKIVTYMKTNSSQVVMINAYAKGTNTQYGSVQTEINNYGWTKVEFLMGGATNKTSSDPISNINLNLVCNTLSTYNTLGKVFFTTPEIYESEYFNYQYNSLWPTDAPFAFFRPGESYVETGNANISLPTTFRDVTEQEITQYFSGSFKAPISSIVQNPQYCFMTQYNPFIKNTLPTDISSYKYYVSDSVNTPSISALYETDISTNKLIFKFNTIMTTPSISIYINGNSAPIFSNDVPSNGVLALYYDGSTWSTDKWTSMPAFNALGLLTPYTTINSITIVQDSYTINPNFPETSLSGSNFYNEDMSRMHLIEVSPRLEIDLTDYIQNMDINRQLDSKSTIVPISTLNADDASISLSGVPAFDGTNTIPLFSNQSNNNNSILSNMLRKNIKFYCNWNLISYSKNNQYENANIFIPAGVFYSDSWSETDIESININCFDITRYLQTLPVPDYVSNYKSVFNIISMLLDRAGFTDYDIDSLYRVTNDPSAPLDISYYFANSQDKTIVAALSELFLAYQIGAYIDEYGIMKFLSLSNILESSNQTSSLSITDDNIYQGGYSVSNSGKIGKLSLRYQEPKIKQTLALQNATDPTQKNSPSFIYTTSTAQPWMSQSIDSVGFNYLNESMSEKDNFYSYNVNDVLDVFHTFNLSANGYAAIENEIVSFVYKEYTINSVNNSKKVLVKNELELASEIDKFIKSNPNVALNTSDGTTKANYNVTITPTGYIKNVQRGLFGTSPSEHLVLNTNLSSKNLSQATASSSGSVTIGGSNASVHSFQPISTNPGISVINCNAPANTKVLVYPTDELDNGYKTYSTKITVPKNLHLFAGGIFFNANSSLSSMDQSYFVELVKSYNGTTVTDTGINFQTGETTTTSVDNYVYLVMLYQQNGSSQDLIAWADVTKMVSNIINNFEKVLIKNSTSDEGINSYTYATAVDDYFHLKVIHYPSDGSDGEQSGELVDVFINNGKVIGWQVPDTSTYAFSYGWKPTENNTLTGAKQLPAIGNISSSTKFGAYVSTKPVTLNFKVYENNILITTTPFPYNQGNAITNATDAGLIREIYACELPLKDRSTNYWFQTNQFLNGLIQHQNIFNNYKSYMMQTQPTAIGINVYDVQYQTPAATNVDILPVQYSQIYYPTGAPADNQYKQILVVDEYALSYSSPLNTGFRAKFAVANNSPYMVWLHRDPDDLMRTSTKLVLWTHEIVAQSDQAILEKVFNANNATEVAQLDSQWIQSKEAANRLIGVVAKAIDGFSKDTSLRIFGNPLIQVGDIVSLTYKLVGINEIPFVVQSVKHTFNSGLQTELVLNAVGPGVQY